MYDPKQVKELQTARLQWLNDKNASAKNVEELRNILRFHENRDYVMNDPLISHFLTLKKITHALHNVMERLTFWGR